MNRRSDNFVNYQERASEFNVGDVVVPFGLLDSQSGRVTAVWPAIGMADVEFVTGNRRFPVEELQRFDANGNAEPPHTNSTPGGLAIAASAARVAEAFEKKSLYWGSKDRQYLMSTSELETGKPCCPRCGEESLLRRAIYKRRDGSSERLLGCPGCMFLIKSSDILNLDGGK